MCLRMHRGMVSLPTRARPPRLLTVSGVSYCASSMAGVEYLNELRRERPGMGRNRHHAATQPGLPSIASLLSGGSRAGDDYPYGLAGVGVSGRKTALRARSLLLAWRSVSRR